ncbi:MAG: hypothetical protein ACPG7F_00355 [Aggregatilineales bacterium]
MLLFSLGIAGLTLLFSPFLISVLSLLFGFYSVSVVGAGLISISILFIITVGRICWHISGLIASGKWDELRELLWKGKPNEP